MKKEKGSVFFFIKIGIYIILAGLLLMKISGHSLFKLIRKYKLNREAEIIYYGAPTYKVNKCIKERNKKLKKLVAVSAKKATELNNILYYTNDTLPIKNALIQANIKPIQGSYFEKCQQTVKYIDDFYEKADSLGYNIFINREKLTSPLRLKNINKKDYENTYKVIRLYYYSNKTKQELIKDIKGRTSYNSFYTDSKTNEEQIALINGIQYTQIVFTEDELQEEKIKYRDINTFFATTNQIKNSTFYFSCYNKKLDSLTFLKKIELFKKIYSKAQINVDGKICLVKLSPND